MRSVAADVSIRIPELAGLDLETTIFGGQTFRWKAGENGWAHGWIADRPVRARIAEDGLVVEPRATQPEGLEAAARRYFDAGRDYDAIRERLFRDVKLRTAARELGGMRILRQPPFETTIGFIVSANNNIPRISKCMSALCRLAGRRIDIDGAVEWTFPEPGALASLDLTTLRADANLGYRDRYVAETAGLVAARSADLEAWGDERTPVLLARLRTLPGVGPKVAECIALFAYGRFDVFPVDTWVRQAYRETYPARGPEATDRQIGKRARRRFGQNAGLAQQYLFESVRCRVRGAGIQT